jgi:hypothetical protein
MWKERRNKLMMRDHLFIPIEQLLSHFATNIRQDIKIVAPNILDPKTVLEWKKLGRIVKEEEPLQGCNWTRSYKTEPNKICQSSDFSFELGEQIHGPFTISFANERANQKVHYHKHHTEVYFSEHQISGYYRKSDESFDKNESIDLPQGGTIIFGPNVVHFMELGGLTIVFEVPAVKDDLFPLDR